jgi:hypothetical protein
VLMRYGRRLRAWQSASWEIRDGSLNRSYRFLWQLALKCSTCRSVSPGAPGRNRLVASAADDEDLAVASCPRPGSPNRPLRSGNAVAIGRVEDRDVIISGSFDDMLQIWDAITGESAGNSFTGHHGRGARSCSRFLGAQLVGGLGAAIIWAMVRLAFMLVS